MNLDGHHRFGRFLFWFAQLVGGITIAAMILFMGGTIISELITKDIGIGEYMVFVLLLCEVLTGISFIISWKRKRLGPILIILFSALICILWGRESIIFVWLHLPVLFSGLLLLFYSYYKEWILKRKP